jgi:hypothetical protein
VRLVDREQVQAEAPQSLDEALVREAFRRDVEQRGSGSN